jgi:hypothetical protein
MRKRGARDLSNSVATKFYIYTSIYCPLPHVTHPSLSTSLRRMDSPDRNDGQTDKMQKDVQE